jgi:hypothetical protein
MMKKVLCSALTLGALATAALVTTPVPAAVADEKPRATTASDAKADKPIQLSDANLDSVTAGAFRIRTGASRTSSEFEKNLPFAFDLVTF